MLKLSFLSSPTVELNNTAIEIESRKGLALLAYLTVTGQSHSRDALSTLLWPDHGQSQARSYLRHTLWSLKKGLGEEWLAVSREQVELNPEAAIWLDVNVFLEDTTAVAAPDMEDLTRLAEAVELYRDDFLAGFTLPDTPDFDEWQFFQTEALRQKLAGALERLVWGYSHQGNYETAIPYGRRWVALDPLHEPAQRHLMQLYSEAGQKAAALRQYEEYAALIEKELGLSPQEETTTLYEAIKAKRIVEPFLKANKLLSPSKSKGIDHQAGGQKVSFLPTSSSKFDRQTVLKQADQHRDSANYGAAIDLLNRLLARNPTDEPTHRELMHLYVLAGRRHESLRQYQT
ncbi:MAG TPA: BTAD domain-containing putative transcriptional regulator, partial [Anaerolineae bacterium]|nr:BTAD domain-containing putative transcriptional regulator [Anaerolineae bacterium]